MCFILGQDTFTLIYTVQQCISDCHKLSSQPERMLGSNVQWTSMPSRQENLAKTTNVKLFA